MKSRILSIVLALSMLAMAFAAIPTAAAVDYTGSVTTTDDVGAPKSVFIEGEPVYVDVGLNYQGTPFAEAIMVELQRADGSWVSGFTDVTDDPVDGWYNSSGTGEALWTWMYDWEPDVVVYDVIAYVDVGPWMEFARTQIVLKREGLTLDPEATPYYYPGQTVTITYITTHVDDFYVQVVNETYVDLTNWTNQEAVDAWWGAVWNIPANAADGHYWLNVRDEATHAIWISTDFWIQRYELLLYSDRYNVLPGDSVVWSYLVQDVAMKTEYTGASIAWQGYYYNTSGNQTNISGTLSGASGSQTYTVPTDIALWSNIWFTFWANESATGRTDEAWMTLSLGQLGIGLSLAGTIYMPGDMVVATVTADVNGEALPGAAVEIVVSKNDTVLSGYGAANLTTALNGQAKHAFTLIDDAAQGSYVVEATVSKVGFTAVMMAMFDVDWDGELIVSLDKETYYGGDDATLSYRILWNNKEVSASIGYVATVDTGILQAGNSSGEDVTIAIPDNYYGPLWVSVKTNVNGHMFEAWASATVSFADIALTVENAYYRPGDTLVFDYQVVTGLSTASLEYSIFDEDGVKVAGETMVFRKSGSFEFDVPMVDWSGSYDTVLVMTDGTGGYASAEVGADIVSDYTLRIWVGKSGYATGEYKPGSKVTIHYAIDSYVFDQLPVYELYVTFGGDPIPKTMLVNDPTGTFTYDVPKEAYSGAIGVNAYLLDGTNPVWPPMSSDYTTIMVNNNLSAWDRSIGGMSAIDFTLLLLIIIMIILLIVIPFMKTRMGGEKPAKPAKPAEPGPP